MTERNILKPICILLTILLAAGLGVMLWQERAAQAEYAESMRAIEAEVQPYQLEQSMLQRELDSLEREVTYTPETAKFMVGFIAAAATDLPYIEAKAAQYGFCPILILDCTRPTADLAAWAGAAGADWEIMLYAPEFTADTNEQVRAVQAALAGIGRRTAEVFFLRDGFATPDNLQLLADDGFLGYTVYNDKPTGGQTETGAVYFEYSYIRTNEASVDSRLAASYAARAAMLMAFDMEKINTGAVTEGVVNTILEKTAQQATAENGCFSTVAAVVEEYKTINATVAAREAEVAAYAAELQQKIDALTATIRAIYAGQAG